MPGCSRRERRRRVVTDRRGGREVSCCFSPVSISSRKILKGSPLRRRLRQRGISRLASSSEYSYRIGSKRPCGRRLSERSRPVVFTPSQRGDPIDTTAFTLTRKGNIAAVGRRDRAVVRSRVGRQPQRFTASISFTYMSALFSSAPSQTNAICLPSREKAGWVSRPGKRVTGTITDSTPESLVAERDRSR